MGKLSIDDWWLVCDVTESMWRQQQSVVENIGVSWYQAEKALVQVQ